jgi:dTDP-4-amino-4,6-dideoxygalactose transaminase
MRDYQEVIEEQKYIPPNPSLPLSWLFLRSTGTHVLPSGNGFLLGEQRIMTFSGSAALYAAAKGLEKIGKNLLLAPSYNCGHEIEPFRRENFDLDFYRVDRTGNVDLEDFESRLKGSQQVALITHYFGFGQNVDIIRSLCNMKDVYLIEDCAHSFLSCTGDKYLGSWGDLSIFSFWKTVPIVDGGCLVVNNPEILVIPPAVRPTTLSVYIKTMKLMMECLFLKADAKSKLCLNILKKIRGFLPWFQSILMKHIHKNYYTLDNQSFNFNTDVLEWGMSKQSFKILSKIDNTKEIKEKRRKNYQYLQNSLCNLNRLEPLFKDLPEGTCPLKFPLIMPANHPYTSEIMAKYPSIYRWWTHFHPSVPWKNFSDSTWLKNNCFVVEIHQDMDKKHLDFLIDCLLKADRKMM